MACSVKFKTQHLSKLQPAPNKLLQKPKTWCELRSTAIDRSDLSFEFDATGHETQKSRKLKKKLNFQKIQKHSKNKLCFGKYGSSPRIFDCFLNIFGFFENSGFWSFLNFLDFWVSWPVAGHYFLKLKRSFLRQNNCFGCRMGTKTKGYENRCQSRAKNGDSGDDGNDHDKDHD